VQKNVADFIVLFASVLWEAMPFIVLGAVIAGFLEEMVPQQLIAKGLARLERYFPGRMLRVMAILLGGLLGLVFPMCECGIVPVMRRLLRKGLPLSCCIAYMLAGPIINVVVISSTYMAFFRHAGGMWIIGLRVGLGYLVAVGTSLFVEWRHGHRGHELLTPTARPPQAGPGELEGDWLREWRQRPLAQRVGGIAETALHDFVDITVFLILGALLTAVVQQTVHPSAIARFSAENPVRAIGVMMGLAVLLCLCSEADAFVAASFTTMRPAAKLGFLVLGPMMDFKLYMMYTRVFRPRLIWTIIPCVVTQVFFYCLIVHYLWEAFGPALPATGSGP